MEIDISDGERAATAMFARSGRKTVPQIFIGALHVGGFDELNDLDQNGRLTTLLSG